MIKNANYFPIIIFWTKTNANDQSQLSILKKSASFVVKNWDVCTSAQKSAD